MKILEIKNNLVKLSYTAQDDLVISGFVVIQDSQTPYVAQVMSLKADGGMNYAIVKLLFTFNEEGVVKNYNGSIPSLDANISKLSADELLDILPIETPLKIGKLAQQKFILNVDYSTLNKNFLICSDNLENTDIFISNLAKQITANNDKSVIFDTTGSINAENKLIFGKDFKLPLNYDTINFIYEHDLNDIDPKSKAIIQDILLEVQEYSQTVLDNFVPFDSFIKVIDAQYKQLNIPELALLKNRLIKYRDENAFAQEASEIQSLRASVRANLSTLIDISAADSVLQNLIVNTVYKEIDELDLFVYSFVKIDNDNADKKLLKKFLSESKISTIISCSHNFKYLYDLKELTNNLILFAPQTVQHDFNAYNVFLNKLNSEEFIIYGKSTQNIPLIVENMTLEELTEFQKEFETSGLETVENAAISAEQQDSFDSETNTYSQESMMNDNPSVDEELEEVSFDENNDDNQEQLDTEEEQIYDETEEEEKNAALNSIFEDENQEVDSEFNSINEPISDELNEYVSSDSEIDGTADTDDSLVDSEEDEVVASDSEFISEEQPDNESPEINENTEEEFVDINEKSDETKDDAEQGFSDDIDEIIEEDSNVEGNSETEDNAEDLSLGIDDIDEFSEELPNEPPLDTEDEQEVLTEDDLDFIGNINESNEVNSEEIISESVSDISDLKDDEIIEVAESTIEEENDEITDSSEFIDEINETEEIANEPIDENEEQKSDNYESETIEADDFFSDIPAENSDENNEEATPVVPIYPVEDETPVSGTQDEFEIGDAINHPKYGDGIVEKMVKFGNKVLCAINFPNGRRLLDPTISQIEKK